jgi:ion channel-forming bestrophin family protein
MRVQPRRGFWREAFALQDSTTLHVMPFVLLLGILSWALCGISALVERCFEWNLALEVGPFELGGAILGILLVMRTNGGIERWWEARKLWGGIVNQSRNLVISAMAYGPADAQWREKVVRWTAVFPHVVRLSLRGERPSSELASLLSSADASQVAAADHMPSFVALRVGELLREACDRQGMDRYAFLQVDRERALLIDHVGGCERILKTPLPHAFSILNRRLILLFLLTLPLALLHRLEGDWLIPFVIMVLAYVLKSLDQTGVELENPFSPTNFGHLPLDEISATIERNLLAILASKPQAVA